MALPPDPRTPAKAAAPTTGGKLTYTIAPGSKPATAAPAAAPNAAGGSLFDVASSRAATETDALVAGYRSLQDYANQQAALRATQQGQLGLATSKYLEGLDLPGRATADYAAAAAAQRSAAAGYSGGLQQTVSDAAAQVQRNLEAGGSPQTAYNPSEAAGNALYALGGALPGTQFGVTGPTVAAGLRALPAQALGYGQMLAFGELGQGQQEAAKFNADIVTARAKQGALAGSYMDTLLKAQQDAQDAAALTAYRNATLTQKANIANATLTQRGQIANQTAGIKQQQIDSLDSWRATQAKIDTFTAQSLADHRTAQDTNNAARLTETAAHHSALETLAAENAANLNAYRQGQIDLGTFNANTSRINAKTSRINALKPPAPSVAAGTAPSVIDTSRSSLNRYYTNQYGKPTDQYGNPLKAGQRFVPIPDYHFNKKGKIVADVKPGKKKGPGGLTPLQTTKYSGIAQTIAQDFRNGYTVTNKDTEKLEVKPPQSINAAIMEMQKKGVPPAIIAEVIAQWWPAATQLGSQPR